MKRIILAIAAASFAFAAVASADTVVPFPAPHVGEVFVSAQTVTTDGTMSNYFAPGSSVVFRAYAVDGKTHKIVTTKTSKYFYVTVPNQTNVKLKYTPRARYASGRYAWTGTWKVPSDY